jgi:flagellar secretion chaperone FliS
MNESRYLRAAVEGATSVGLVTMLYDRLCADVLRAAEAVRQHDVEARCAQIKHALLIVQQLEGSLDHEQGGPAARTLAEFYSYARAKMMEAQIKGDAPLLEKVAGHFAEVRGAWQQAESGSNAPVAARAVAAGGSALSCTV